MPKRIQSGIRWVKQTIKQQTLKLG